MRHAKVGHRVVLARRPRRARLPALDAHRVVVRGLPVEAEVLVDVELHAVPVRQERLPLVQAEERVVHDDPRALALARSGRLAHGLVSLHVAAVLSDGVVTDRCQIDVLLLDGVLADGWAEWLVRHTEHDDDIAVRGLRDELGDDANVVQGPLGVGDTHGTVQDVDGAKTSRVVPAVLGARKRMQVKVDAETVLAGPLDSLQEVPIRK